MKLAAITARTISFDRKPVQKPFSCTPERAAFSITVRGDREARMPHLTPRELEVLSLLCEGLSNKHISRRLNISGGTVKVHIGKILSELGVSSRLQAVVEAHRRGMIDGSTSAQREARDGAPAEAFAFAQGAAAA